MSDLVDYLRDKLEHADDPTPFRAYGFGGRLLWQYEVSREASDASWERDPTGVDLRADQLHGRIVLPRKRWWRR